MLSIFLHSNIIGKARGYCASLNRQIKTYVVNNTAEADTVCQKHEENMLVLSDINKNKVIKFLRQCKLNIKKMTVFRAKNNLGKLNKKTTNSEIYFWISLFGTFQILKIKFSNSPHIVLCERVIKQSSSTQGIIIGTSVAIIVLLGIILYLYNKQVRD